MDIVVMRVAGLTIEHIYVGCLVDAKVQNIWLT